MASPCLDRGHEAHPNHKIEGSERLRRRFQEEIVLNKDEEAEAAEREFQDNGFTLVLDDEEDPQEDLEWRKQARPEKKKEEEQVEVAYCPTEPVRIRHQDCFITPGVYKRDQIYVCIVLVRRQYLYKYQHAGINVLVVGILELISSGALVCKYTRVIRKSDELDAVSLNEYVMEIDCVQTIKEGYGRKTEFRPLTLNSENSFIANDVLFILFFQKDVSAFTNLLEKADDTNDEELEFSLDGGSTNNVSIFINHSCDPNLFLQCMLEEHHDPRLARVFLVASEDIPPLQSIGIVCQSTGQSWEMLPLSMSLMEHLNDPVGIHPIRVEQGKCKADVVLIGLIRFFPAGIPFCPNVEHFMRLVCWVHWCANTSPVEDANSAIQALDATVTTMTFFNKAGSLLRQNLCNKHVSIEGSASNLSIFQLRRHASSSVFVAGLSKSTDDVELRKTFQEYGKVVDVENANSASQALDATDLKGRTISVVEAIEKRRNTGYGNGGGAIGELLDLSYAQKSLGIVRSRVVRWQHRWGGTCGHSWGGMVLWLRYFSTTWPRLRGAFVKISYLLW
ncbi:hypothetical protein POM88_047371 [Heracleum sosnowskyi]|uniref:SET domain-containing protein n=1 Tax=Heracleum sosnowskyi TaxID=360622 RepID=A0AAD8GU01_9APIA|nr:hypothetical protein POM88_047371 [Heracleum sosnowskyi]